VFLAAYFVPAGAPRFDGALREALLLLRSYAREHMFLGLVPAFFIAGAIGVFVRQASVIRYLGARANRVLAYAVASVSGTVLAVCSCTVIPLFAGIYRMGAGLGPATAFLYSGPAINVMAIILTARVLGPELGLARAVGAIAFSVVIGLLMHLIFRKEEFARAEAQRAASAADAAPPRPLWQTTGFFALMVAILVFANWGSHDGASRAWQAVHAAKWWITGALAATLAVSLVSGVSRREAGDWMESTWGFVKQILPLLLVGIMVSGFLFGQAGQGGIVPPSWVARSVGGNSLFANFISAVVGALMYFCTLVEVPILQGLMGNGMGKGPALALLLAGPALSLPNMLVIRQVLGTKKAVTYIALVIVMATFTGMVFGAFAG
jgi:uncharacterized membrane protein YraQ (UPF0718 family)